MVPVACLLRWLLSVETMAYSLDQIDWCDVPLLPAVADPDWEREVVRRFGFASSLAKYLTPVRWLMDAEQIGEARVTPGISVPLRAFISMVVAMDSSCRHCYGAFRSMLKILGYPEGLIRELEESFATNQLTNKEQAALEFARKVSRSAPRPSESDLRELAAAGYSQLEIAEIAYLAGLNAGGNRLATLLAVPPSRLEEIDANWFDKLKRPFTRKEFRAALSSVQTVSYPCRIHRSWCRNYQGLGRLSGERSTRHGSQCSLEFHDHFTTGQGAHLCGGSPWSRVSGLRSRSDSSSSRRGLDRCRNSARANLPDIEET